MAQCMNCHQHVTVGNVVCCECATQLVDVVRCVECRHSRNWPEGLCYKDIELADSSKGYKGEVVCVEENDFCSYGERRDAP